MLTSLVYLQQGNVKKSKKMMKKLILTKKIFISFERHEEFIKQSVLIKLYLIQTLKQPSGFDYHAMEIKVFNLEIPGSKKLNIVENISKLNLRHFKIQQDLKSSAIARAKHLFLIILLLCINFPT